LYLFIIGFFGINIGERRLTLAGVVVFEYNFREKGVKSLHCSLKPINNQTLIRTREIISANVKFPFNIQQF
jgi:hypothetical protein